MHNSMPQANQLLNFKDLKKTIDGKKVDLFVLKNDNGITFEITNYGGKVVSLWVPDRKGKYGILFRVKSNSFKLTSLFNS